jgi:hypothetical protein
MKLNIQKLCVHCRLRRSQRKSSLQILYYFFAIGSAPIQICREMHVKKLLLERSGIGILVNERAVCRRTDSGESFLCSTFLLRKKKCGNLLVLRIYENKKAGRLPRLF